MSKLLIADLTNEKLRRSLGGGLFTFPILRQKGDLYFGLRFSKEVAGVHVVDHPIVREIRVSIGELDLRPEAGQFQLKVGSGSAVVGTNVTAALDWDSTADEIATALNALSVVGTAVVVEDNETFLITGISDAITAYANSLRPISFVRVESYQVDGTTTQAIRLQRAPFGFTDQYTQRVPTAPSIVRVQAGGYDGDIEWNEIQKLTVPLDFQGSFQIRSNDEIQRTGLLGSADTVETISTAINPAADGSSIGVAVDSAGQFIVTQHPTEPAALIEFAGSMAGAAQDLLKVTVFDAPEGDYWLTVSLDTTKLSEAFRDTDEITAPLEIWVDVEDPDNDEIVRTIPVYRADVRVQESITHADLGTAANIDWNRPPAPKSYIPFNASQVITGQRHYSSAVGNGAATTFAIAHNLSTEIPDVRVRQNSNPGALLIHGTDYEVEITDDDNLDVTVLGSYASPAPGNSTLVVTVADLAEEASFAGNLTLAIAQVTNLQTTLDALATRLTTLEAQIGATAGAQTATGTASVDASWPLNTAFFTLRPQTLPADFEAPASLIGYDPASAGLSFRSLMGAVGNTTPGNLTNPVPTANSTHTGKAYVAVTADTTFPGGGIRAGDFAIADGVRSRWIRATRGWIDPGATLTANATSDVLTSSGNLSTLGIGNGTAIAIVSSAGDPPAPLTVSDTAPQGTVTPYYIRDVSADSLTFKLATTSGGSAINLTDAGTGTHRYLILRDSYHPAEMEAELCNEIVLPEDLTLGSVASLQFGFEAAILYGPRRPRDRKTEARWRVVIESGVMVSASGNPAPNIASIAWVPMTVADIGLSPTPRPYRFGVAITRSSANVLTATKTIGRSTSAAVAPNGGIGGVAFYLRARLCMFDTNDSAIEPAGLVLLRGLKVDLDGADSADLGKLTVG